MNAIRRLSFLATLATFALLLVGATVSATGAGLACPDWPLCQGRIVPPLERLVLIEYSHRLLASAVGIIMAVLAVLTLRRRSAEPRLGRLMIALLVMLALQVGLGGVTVLSELKPLVVGTHLALAMGFLAGLVTFTARAHWAGPDTVAPSIDPRPTQREVPAGSQTGRDPAALRSLAHLTLGMTFVQIMLGGFVSAFGAGLACTGFPLCDGRVLPAWQPGVVIHVIHRLLAFAIVVAIAVLASRARDSGDRITRLAAAGAMLLVIVQVLLGALNVWTHLAPAVRIAHLAGAAALLAVLTAVSVRVRLGYDVRPAANTVERQPRADIRRVADYLALTKPRIIVLLLVTTITTMVVAAGGAGFGAALAVYTLLGGAMAAGAANAINCYWDRDIDAVMRRTRTRPVPAGRVVPARALAFGIVLGTAAVMTLGLLVNWLSALLAAAAIAFYVGVYTIWLKRSTPQNIVIGGAAGAMPPLVGWAAVTNSVGLPALLMFAIIFLWTPPHFWALALNREDEYRAAGVPMLPVVRGRAETLRQIVLYTFALFAATLGLATVGALGPIYVAAAIMLAIPWVVLVVRLLRRTTAATAWAFFEYSIAYLGLLFAAMALDRLLA